MTNLYLHKKNNTIQGLLMHIDHKFPITWIPITGFKPKCLGISHCPGKYPIKAEKKENLFKDLTSITDQRIKCIITLLSKEELNVKKITHFEETIRNFSFKHYIEEIDDLSVPSKAKLIRFKSLIQSIVSEIKLGNAVLIHCNAGLGRSGLVASILLKEMTNESNPIEYVRNFRKGAVENQKQEKFISNWQMITV